MWASEQRCFEHRCRCPATVFTFALDQFPSSTSNITSSDGMMLDVFRSQNPTTTTTKTQTKLENLKISLKRLNSNLKDENWWFSYILLIYQLPVIHSIRRILFFFTSLVTSNQTEKSCNSMISSTVLERDVLSPCWRRSCLDSLPAGTRRGQKKI